MKEIWVFNEAGSDAVNELLTKGRELADQAGMKLCRVSVELPEFQNDLYTEALYQLVRQRPPEIILFAAAALGKTLAPSLAAKLGTGLTADCTALEIDPETGILQMIRPAYGGNVLATVICANHRPQMAAIRPGVFKAVPVEYEDIYFKPDLAGVPKRMKKIQSLDKAGASELPAAEFIVAGGRGMGTPENFQCLEELAVVLGGAVGASKAVVDIGWKSYEHQIGLSGKNAAPAVYVACGISGAIQHWEGIKNAAIIVAINSDPDAPIFEYADFGLVGDVLDVVPELIAQLKARKKTN